MDSTELAKLIYAKRRGEAIRLDLALLERVGDFNVVHQGAAELIPR